MRRKNSILALLKQRYQAVFPERQIFLRSGGRVRFLTVSPFVQTALATCLLGLATWAAITSFHFLTRDFVLEAKQRQISNMANSYGRLTDAYSTLETHVIKRTEQLEARQRFLEDLMQRDLPIGSNASVSSSPADHPADAETAAAADAPAGTQTATDSTAQSRSDGASTDRANREARPALPAAEPTTLPADPSDLPLSDASSLMEYLLPALRTPSMPASPHRNAARQALDQRLTALEALQREQAAHLLADRNLRLAAIDQSLSELRMKRGAFDGILSGQNPAQGGPVVMDVRFTPVYEPDDAGIFEKLRDLWAYHDALGILLARMPLGEPVDNYYISSGFGRRRDPMTKAWTRHPGIDLAAYSGTQIKTVASGIVISAGWSGAYGRMIEIDHQNGYRTRYGHLRRLRVSEGDHVSVGQHIGDMGRSGRTTGTHLHYEIWFGDQLLDPYPYVRAKQNVFQIHNAQYEDRS